jgi:hypothetical protein
MYCVGCDIQHLQTIPSSVLRIEKKKKQGQKKTTSKQEFYQTAKALEDTARARNSKRLMFSLLVILSGKQLLLEENKMQSSMRD